MIYNTYQYRRRNQSNSSSERNPIKDRKNIIDFNVCKFVLSSECIHASEDRKSEEDDTFGYNIDDQDNIRLNSQGCCSICLDDLEEGDTLAKSKFPEVSSCGHIFHYDCLHKWLSNHDECPVCRRNLLVQDMLPQFDNNSGSRTPVTISNSSIHHDISNIALYHQNSHELFNINSRRILPMYSLSLNFSPSMDENDESDQATLPVSNVSRMLDANIENYGSR